MARRPSNRRELITDAAAALFHARGFHNVSVNDIADQLEITPSALYHHYRDKQDLLYHVVLDGMSRIDADLRAASTLEGALDALATRISRSEGLAIVWEREARHLEGEHRASIEVEQRRIIADLDGLIQARRRGLAAWQSAPTTRAVIGAMSGFRRRLSISRQADEELLRQIGAFVASADPAPLGAPIADAEAPASSAFSDLIPRREQVIQTAIGLFAEYGYQSVTMSDIGKAADVVASALYRHVGAKADLLVTAVNRCSERLRLGASRALQEARDPDEALTRLVRAHVEVSLGDPDLLSVMANEQMQLPEKDRVAVRRAQGDYLATWLQVLDAARPELAPARARILVRSVQSMNYFVVHAPDADREQPGLADWLTDVGGELLRRT